jgi:hypothetical protein
MVVLRVVLEHHVCQVLLQACVIQLGDDLSPMMPDLVVLRVEPRDLCQKRQLRSQVHLQLL